MNVLAFFAHPDDETMLCGGTLALAARQGARVHYLCATRGEGGEVGEPPRCARDALGKVRAHELSCAVAALMGTSLSFLPYVDPLVGEDNTLFPFAQEDEEVAEHLLVALRAKNARVLLTHGSDGEYGHPARLLCHRAARLALQRMDDPPLLYTVQAIYADHPKPRLANNSDAAHLVINVHAALEEKLRAALCHATQHALFVRRASEETGRRLSVAEVLTHSESLRRVAPPLDGDADDVFARLFAPYLIPQLTF